MRKKKTRKTKMVKTSISLPQKLWEELKIKSLKERKTLSEVIVEELEEIRRIRKLGVLEVSGEQSTEIVGEEG